VRGLCRKRCCEDRIPNPFDIFQHFIVPEAEHAIAMLSEPSIPRGVPLVFGVLATIDLYRKSHLSTGEIDDIWSDRFLAHEFKSGE
jgi:hypothetical protein